MSQIQDRIKYSILDPTGNITALVETETEIAMQPAVAAEIMRLHPEVEQVGFVRFVTSGKADVKSGSSSAGQQLCDGELRMAGGEFCGNATMSAAALLLMRSADGVSGIRKAGTDHADVGAWQTVRLKVSGASEPVEVKLKPCGAKADPVEVKPEAAGVILKPAGAKAENAGDCHVSFQAQVKMPPALGIEQRAFSFAGKDGELPLVRMEGISHIIIGENSPFFGMKEEPEEAEQAVRQWCKELAADGLGLMFLEAEPAGGGERRFPVNQDRRRPDGRNDEREKELTFQLTPLVYVPAGSSGGTVFWENSCASGSAAAGLYLTSGQAQDLIAGRTPGQARKTIVRLREPGGVLSVEYDPAAGSGNVLLHGQVSMMQ